MRFPFFTSFHIAGIICGTLFKSRKYIQLTIAIAGTTIYFIISYTVIFPNIIFRMENISTGKVDNAILQQEFLTVNNNPVNLSDTLNKSCNLIELFFVGCRPCENKKIALRELKQKLDSTSFQLVFICDGSITSFASFTDYAKKNQLPGDIFLYDSKKYIEQYITDTRGFPVELLCSNKEVLFLKEGFNMQSKDLYLKDELGKIKKIIN
jgi:hypothetical protein